MKVRNAKYATQDESVIDCEIYHSKFGWVPYTLNQSDADNNVNNSDLLEAIGSDIEPYSEPDVEDIKTYWRSIAALTKAQFCVAIKRAGILPPEEAIEAAKGGWPETFSSALSGLPVDEDEAQIVWATVTTIPRNDVVLEALRVYAGLTEEQVDEMFGWGE